jgi:phosphoglycerate dehydrogenase-like enzyme
MKLLIVMRHHFELWNAPAWLAERLREDFPGLEVVQLPNYEGIDGQLADTEVLLAWSLRPEQVKAAKKLGWIHSPVAAVHLLMIPEIIQSDIVVTNAREINGPVVAEHVIAQIFALAKCLPTAVRMQQQRAWGQDAIWHQRPKEIAGATLGLVGVGSIGSEVAKRAAALGMRVFAVRENSVKPKAQGVEKVFELGQIDEMLALADYVVLAAPVTPRTNLLMNAARIAKMKPDSCLINVGRGPLIDDAALAEALSARRIRGAALDVFVKEPLPESSPYWHLENVLITPHTAAISEYFWERQYELLRENLRRYLAGESLLAVVDKSKGY